MMRCWPWTAAAILLLCRTAGALAGNSADAALPVDELWRAAALDPAPPATSITAEEPAPTEPKAAPPGRTLTRRGPGHASAAKSSPADAAPRDSSWLRTSMSLGTVIVVILLLAWGYRVVMSRSGELPFAFRGRNPGVLEVIGRMTLSQKHSLCLVRVGPRMILLGLGGDGVRPLDVIDQPDTVARILGARHGDQPNSARSTFEACLTGESAAYNEDSPPAAAAETGRAAGLVRTLERMLHVAKGSKAQ